MLACNGLVGRRACERIRSRALLAAIVNSHGRNRRVGSNARRLMNLKKCLLENIFRGRTDRRGSALKNGTARADTAPPLRERGLVALA